MSTFGKIGIALGAIGVLLMNFTPLGYVIGGIGFVIMIISALFNLFK